MVISGNEEVQRWVLSLVFVCLFSCSKSELRDLQCLTMPDDIFHGIVVNCSLKGLQPSDIPILDIPVNNTTSLLLDYNSLPYIKNGSFYRLLKLKHLQIQHSGIKYLELEALGGLAELLSLSFYGNFLDISQPALPLGIFNHTPYLQELNLGNNPIATEFGNYSKFIDFFSLPELRYLCITSFHLFYIGGEFERLDKLEQLDIDGASLKYIVNGSLEGLKYSKVKHFKLSFANPIKFETGVFKNLPDDIISLTLYKVFVGNSDLLRAMEPLQGRTIPVLYFNTVCLPTYISPKLQIEDGLINKKNLEFLLNICVSNLTWKNSNIMTLDLGDFTFGDFALSSALLNCTTSLDLSGNRLQNYEPFFITMLPPLHALEELRLSLDGLPKHTVNFWADNGDNFFQNIIQVDYDEKLELQPDLPSVSLADGSKRKHSSPHLFYSDEEYLLQEERLNQHALDRIDLNLSESNPQYLNLSSNPNMPINATNEKKNGTLYIHLPKHLRYVSFDTIRRFNFGKYYRYLIFGNPNNVTEVYCRYSMMPSVIKSLIFGLNKVRLIDLTGSLLDQEVPLALFDSFPSLQVLVLRKTQEDPHFLQNYGHRWIKKLAKLVYLDLADNRLSVLPKGMFQENRLLRYLCLAQNRFSSIPFQIRLVPSLEILDMRVNAFSDLGKDEQEDIDKHVAANRYENFTLLLEGNNLQCICSDLLFTAWMKRTQTQFDRNGRLACLREDGKTVMIESFLDTQQMWRMCHGEYYFMLSLLLLFAILILYLAVFLISMYRTFIIGKLKQMFVSEFQRQTRQDFTYDVFIGYAERECVFVRFHLLRYLEGGLKLKAFVHQRDLRQDLLELGTALKDSWRTLLVITEAFLNHEMSENIMKTATFFESPSKQDSIIVMVTQDLLYAIPDYVLRIVKDENIIVLPDLETPFSYEVTETLRTRILY